MSKPASWSAHISPPLYLGSHIPPPPTYNQPQRKKEKYVRTRKESKNGLLYNSEHKKHSSKYDGMFKGKSKEEIANIINSMDISPSRKSRLRSRYVS